MRNKREIKRGWESIRERSRLVTSADRERVVVGKGTRTLSQMIPAVCRADYIQRKGTGTRANQKKTTREEGVKADFSAVKYLWIKRTRVREAQRVNEITHNLGHTQRPQTMEQHIELSQIYLPLWVGLPLERERERERESVCVCLPKDKAGYLSTAKWPCNNWDMFQRD